jgi:hypothetical protein
MQAHDHLGNRRLSGGDTFLVWLEGPATVHANVKVKDTGVYTATYNLTISGMYSLYITNGTPPPPSPFFLPPVQRPADPPFCRAGYLRHLGWHDTWIQAGAGVDPFLPLTSKLFEAPTSGRCELGSIPHRSSES